MKASALLFIIAVALSSVVHADLIVTQSVDSPMQKGELVAKLKDNKVRVNMKSMAGDISTIMDGTTGDMITIMHSQKQYIKMSGEVIRAMASQMLQASGSNAQGNAKLVPTGKKEKINGYETEAFTYENGKMKMTYWVAKDYPKAKEVRELMETMQKNQQNATAWMGPKPSDFDGIPIRTETEAQGQKMTVTLTSVEEAEVPASEMAPPADYSEMKIPTQSAPAPAPAQ